MSLYSYHIFMFPFKWEMAGREHLSFSERTNIKSLQLSPGSSWENIATPKNDIYKRELYNEQNFFYPFTHQVLYDEDAKERIIKHYERKETYERDVAYKIHVIAGGTENYYTLNLRSVGLNLYGTGVGVLIFYLENHSHPEWNDVIRINQYGRRIYPPFIDVEKGIAGTKNAELADFISIEGLNGNPLHYYEDFTSYQPDTLWKPARFIKHLIRDFNNGLEIGPVIDDRMFVMCWHGNNKLKKEIGDKLFTDEEEWYRFLFIDGDSATCQNDDLRRKLVKKQTYIRWQKWKSLYGCSRYSMVFLSPSFMDTPLFLIRNFRTIYARMAELSLVQRASILKFSEEVTCISKLEDKRTDKLVVSISDLYRQYIRFINKVYFSEVTAQEQGIEIYNMLQRSMKIRRQVRELDNQIEELHSYVTILEDKERNTNIELLTIISSVIIIPTLIVAFAAMDVSGKYWMPIVFILLAVITVFAIQNRKPEKQKLLMIYIVFFLVYVLLFVLTFMPKK